MTSDNTSFARPVSVGSSDLRWIEAIQQNLRTKQTLQYSAGLWWSVSQQRKKGKKYASHSNSNNPDRRGHPAVASESLYSHGRQHKVDFERRCDHCGSAVAPQCFWIVPLPLAYPRRDLGISDQRARPGIACAVVVKDSNQQAHHLRRVVSAQVDARQSRYQMKRTRVVGTVAMFLLFGIAAPANAGQQKPEEKARPAQQQQAKPERQQQAQAPKQQQQQHQQQAQAPRQQQQQRQQQAQAPKQQQQREQQARGQQDKQQRQQDQQQARADKQQQQRGQQQARGQQDQQRQQQARGQQNQQRQQQQQQRDNYARQQQARGQRDQQQLQQHQQQAAN